MAEVHIQKPGDSGNSDAIVPRGHYKVIRVDGTDEVRQGEISFTEVRRLIGCDSLDTVRIGRHREFTMFVDDTGMIDGRPVNAKATTLYHSICKPGTIWAIHGDVVIVSAGGLV